MSAVCVYREIRSIFSEFVIFGFKVFGVVGFVENFIVVVVVSGVIE